MSKLAEENIMCMHCIYDNPDPRKCSCKRVDHKVLQFAKPWFKSYDCGSNHVICRDFKPKPECIYISRNWTTFDDYWKDYVRNWLPYSNTETTIGLVINGDLSVRYYVKLMDFVNGTMFTEDGKLKTVSKHYYKRTKDGFGYKLVKEQVGYIKL